MKRLILPFALALLSVLALRAAPKKTDDWQLVLKQKFAQEAIGGLLDNQLPLKLDADAVYPTVAMPPGGTFHPVPLRLDADSIHEPLPPGDYVIRAVAFCSEYSVHRPGAGVAYEMGPIQGKAAQAISMLLWRGTIEKNRTPRQLQSVSWAIQSGLTYAKMPKAYQAMIDDVIPDYRTQLSGDFIQNLEDLYQANAKAAGLPPLEKLLAGMGKPGELALSANRQRRALLRKNTTDQIRDQTLFAGQESGIAPVKAIEGRWTEKIPGVAYVRYRVVGGNVRKNNEIQIRILPEEHAVAADTLDARVVFASYALGESRLIAAARKPGVAGSGPTVAELVSDSIGYAVGRGAQVLFFVPVVEPKSPKPGSVGTATQVTGDVTLTRNGTTEPLTDSAPISMNDTITTGSNDQAQLTFADGTQLTMGANTSITVDNTLITPGSAGQGKIYHWLEGSFRYVSGFIGKEDNEHNKVIEGPYGEIGIRGTEFVARLDAVGRVTIDLISGSLAITPKQTETTDLLTGPIKIVFDNKKVKTSPLTQQQYDATEAPLLIW